MTRALGCSFLFLAASVACGPAPDSAGDGEGDEGTSHGTGGRGSEDRASGGSASGGSESASSGGSPGSGGTFTGSGGESPQGDERCRSFISSSGASNPCYLGVDGQAHCIQNDGTTVTLSGVPGPLVSASGWDYTTRACVVTEGGAVHCGDYENPSEWISQGATQVSGMASGYCALVFGQVQCESTGALPETIETGGAEVTELGCFSAGCCAATGEGKFFCAGNTTDALGSTSLETVEVSVPEGKSVKQIAAGQAHLCALLSEGRVQCWGQDWNGQLGGLGANTTTGMTLAASGAVSVASGQFHTCVAYDDGSVRCAGQSGVHGAGQNSLELVLVPGVTTAVAVTAGRYASCALLSDGSVVCWGDFGPGEPGTNETTVPIPIQGEKAAICSAL